MSKDLAKTKTAGSSDPAVCMRPPVSVVLTAYKGEAWIEAQMQSILDELQPGDELLVGIDSSRKDDRTWQIVEAIKKKAEPIDVRITAGPGQGVIANFESLLARAGNPIVFLSDQDDLWLPGKVERVLEEFEDPAVMAVVHDARIVDAALETISLSYQKAHGSKNGLLSNLVRNSFIGCCMALRHSVIEAALPFPPVPMHDQYLGLLALRLGKVRFLEDVLMLYRRHADNQTQMHPARKSEQIKWRLQIATAMITKTKAVRSMRNRQRVR